LASLPQEVEEIEFSKENRRLDIKIGFSCGTTFACPVFGIVAPVYDTREKTWRSPEFLPVQGLPDTPWGGRLKNPNGDCGVKGVSVSWARLGSDVIPSVRGTVDESRSGDAGQGRGDPVE